MDTKEKLLELLEKHKGEFLSGADIAEMLSISRTAVWKASKALRQAGYPINAVTNRGYSLDQRSDILSEQGVRNYLSPQCADFELEVMQVTESTNALLRRKAAAGAKEGSTVIANEQTAGRGRLGRDFFSPPDTGIYLSLLLRPKNYLPEQAMNVTTMAAVAVCEAIEEVAGKDARIKWVNDVYIGHRKVCGILTEGSFNLENGSLDYVVLGVGMNAYQPEGGFPGDIADRAGAIFHERVSDGKNRLAAAFLNHFMAYYRGEVPGGYGDKYRAKSMVIGHDIEVISSQGQRSAYALDVDKDCRLIVRYEDGSIERLFSGEISIRI